MLSSVIQLETVQINKNAESFEEAIVKATQPMFTSGFIDQAYTDEILKIYKESGPYIVITKHVALPHAPSNASVHKTGIGFTKLKYPVYSGNKANDPVKYLFPLCATDSHSHIGLLAELANLLGNPLFLKDLESVQTSEEFMFILKKFEEENNYA